MAICLCIDYLLPKLLHIENIAFQAAVPICHYQLQLMRSRTYTSSCSWRNFYQSYDSADASPTSSQSNDISLGYPSSLLSSGKYDLRNTAWERIAFSMNSSTVFNTSVRDLPLECLSRYSLTR